MNDINDGSKSLKNDTKLEAQKVKLSNDEATSPKRRRFSLIQREIFPRTTDNVQQDNMQLMHIVELLQKVVERQTALEKLVKDLKKTSDSLVENFKNLERKMDDFISACGNYSSNDDDMGDQQDQSQQEINEVNAVLTGLFESMERSAGEFENTSQKHSSTNSQSNTFAHTCLDCSKSFSNITSLKKHNAVKHNDGTSKKFQCNRGECKKSYDLHSSLSRHIRDKH